MTSTNTIFTILLFLNTFVWTSGNKQFHKAKRSTAHGHDLHKDHVIFLGEEAAREFYGLTQKESIRRLRMLVPRIDINKDGYVDDNELTIWIRHKLQPWTVHEDIDAIFHDIDADYDNQITWDEYMKNIFGFIESEKDKKWSRENLYKYIEDDRLKWKYADKNDDKNLTREEFEFFHHPREHEAMSEYIAVLEMNEHDKDKDGFLSLKEYLDSINSPAFAALDMKNFYEIFDLNHDGKLDLMEIEIMKKPKSYDKAEDEAIHLMEYADGNGDGKLGVEEFAANYHIFVGSYGTRFGQVLHDEF
ncbi:calumenin-like [Dendronephthya gigantea]|uniref:calumenin-like n=1 Tax=Dendronephthya gigantea TaxID=151771 RepID=UPI00106B2A5F|nr:calumenin-like [Dendronephthya gigantea]XP_028417760.1 calumenin-like [Dendronephthya gigantea]